MVHYLQRCSCSFSGIFHGIFHLRQHHPRACSRMELDANKGTEIEELPAKHRSPWNGAIECRHRHLRLSISS